MAKIAIIFGIGLILLGVGGYFAADAGQRSFTAFIPAFVGVPLLICGLIAMNPSLRKHAMHAAAVFGLLGFIAPLGRLIPQMAKGNMPTGLAGISQIAMSVLCLIFVILCVRSFVNARKQRQLGAGFPV